MAVSLKKKASLCVCVQEKDKSVDNIINSLTNAIRRYDPKHLFGFPYAQEKDEYVDNIIADMERLGLQFEKITCTSGETTRFHAPFSVKKTQ